MRERESRVKEGQRFIWFPQGVTDWCVKRLVLVGVVLLQIKDLKEGWKERRKEG